MIKIVVFDFDGTLADTEQWTLDIYNELAIKYGYKTYTIDQLEEMKKLPLSKIIANIDIPYYKIFFLLKEGQKILKKHINDVHAFNKNLKTVLIEIKKAVGNIGIISSNTKKNVRRFCKNHDIDNLEFVVSSPLFSKENKIFRILKKYKFDPQEMLYVGDEVRDVEASRRAGIKVAAATWGYNDRSLLEEANPDFLIDDITELINILAGLNRSK